MNASAGDDLIARVLAVVLLLLGQCVAAGAQPLACAGALKPQQLAELMFGRKIGNRVVVSAAAWKLFLDREITPRFPDGLTVIDAYGQWRDPVRTRIVREPSKLVQIVLPGRGDDLAHLQEVADAYKQRFRQQSVGIIVRDACVSF